MPPDRPAIAVTGAHGFIGRNLVARLRELGHAPAEVVRETPQREAEEAIGGADIVFHLAGANRPDHPADFQRDNEEQARRLARLVVAGDRKPLVVFSSSTKALERSAYGESKRMAEAILLGLDDDRAARVEIYRLPNVFGKWSKPFYNSAVATFCHCLARGEPIRIDDPDRPIDLLYIDDLIDQWLALMAGGSAAGRPQRPEGVHSTTVGEVAACLSSFAAGRDKGEVRPVGDGLDRALYATFVSFLPEQEFARPLQAHRDERGQFVEMLKTASCGQISCLTAHPGVTRGGHYHHSKVEKFLVVEGEARFRYRHILTGQSYEIRTAAERPMLVETIPGWAHEITNVGAGPMVCLVWANEIFDPDRPDTIAAPL